MADETQELPKIGTIWTRGGKRYVIVGNERTTKDGDAANWSPAVEYQVLDATDPVRIRTLQDFLVKHAPE